MLRFISPDFMRMEFFIRIKAWMEEMCWGLTRIIWTYAGIRLSGDVDFPERIMRITGKWFWLMKQPPAAFLKRGRKSEKP